MNSIILQLRLGMLSHSTFLKNQLQLKSKKTHYLVFTIYLE